MMNANPWPTALEKLAIVLIVVVFGSRRLSTVNVYGEFSETQIAEILAAAKLHPEFEPSRTVEYVCRRPNGDIEVGVPRVRNDPLSRDLAFFVRLNGSSYVVDDRYAEFS